jgi:hypothetical protein
MAPREDHLSLAVKRFIVEALACFDGPTAVVKSVKETFGVEVTKQRIAYYDPTTKAGAALDPALKQIFEERRKRFLEDVDASRSPIRRCGCARCRASSTVPGKQAAGIVANLCEAAAKEIGGAFTNERKLSGKLDVDATIRPAPATVLKDLDDIFGGAVAAVTDAGSTAAEPAASDPVLPDGAAGGSAAEPGAPAPGEAVAGAERSVFLADDDLPPQGR